MIRGLLMDLHPRKITDRMSEIIVLSIVNFTERRSFRAISWRQITSLHNSIQPCLNHFAVDAETEKYVQGDSNTSAVDWARRRLFVYFIEKPR